MREVMATEAHVTTRKNIWMQGAFYAPGNGALQECALTRVHHPSVKHAQAGMRDAINGHGSLTKEFTGFQNRV